MAQTTLLSRQQTVLRYLACYTLFALLLALGYLVVFVLWPATIIAMLAMLNWHRDTNDLVYLLSMLILGTGLFILVMAAEPYLRNGIRRRQLLKRFVRLAVPVGITGLLGLLLQIVSLAILS